MSPFCDAHDAQVSVRASIFEKCYLGEDVEVLEKPFDTSIVLSCVLYL